MQLQKRKKKKRRGKGGLPAIGTTSNHTQPLVLIHVAQFLNEKKERGRWTEKSKRHGYKMRQTESKNKSIESDGERESEREKDI